MVLQLRNLTTLQLSNSLVQTIPKELGTLRLVQIDFSCNQLGLGNCNFEWLLGNPLNDTLVSLNLNQNKVL